jgi:hypothetical protein
MAPADTIVADNKQAQGTFVCHVHCSAAKLVRGGHSEGGISPKQIWETFSNFGTRFPNFGNVSQNFRKIDNFPSLIQHCISIEQLAICLFSL